jgi:hypothetical protein
MKKYIYILVFAFGTNLALAQYSGQVASNLSSGGDTNAGVSAQISMLLGPATERGTKRVKNYDNFQGSPYVADLFLPSTLFYKDENVGSIFYRHNALHEEIEIKKSNLEDENERGLARDKDISILVNGKKMSFKTFVTSKKRTLNGYLIALKEGKKYDLYKRTHVKFTEAQAAANSFTKPVPARFAQFTEYYFQKEGVNRMDEIPARNGKLLNLLGSDAKSKLKPFLKENGLNIKNEADLIRVFEFLNN